MRYSSILTSDVPPEKREGWFSQRLREGIQVTISHPKIIETGMDLLSHPSLIFFETGYSLHTLRQASRRSWRIGQRQPVRVFYLQYDDTMQSSCLRLMAKKMLVSLGMEGKFSDGGVQSFEEYDDMLTAMARELVTKHGIGESADALWKQLQTELQRTAPPKPVLPPDSEVERMTTPAPAPITIPLTSTEMSVHYPEEAEDEFAGGYVARPSWSAARSHSLTSARVRSRSVARRCWQGGERFIISTRCLMRLA